MQQQSRQKRGSKAANFLQLFCNGRWVFLNKFSLWKNTFYLLSVPLWFTLKLRPCTGESKGETRRWNCCKVPRFKLRHFDASGFWLDNLWHWHWYWYKGIIFHFEYTYIRKCTKKTQKQMLTWQGPTCMEWKCQTRRTAHWTNKRICTENKPNGHLNKNLNKNKDNISLCLLAPKMKYRLRCASKWKVDFV
jgi:hypothetical protein